MLRSTTAQQRSRRCWCEGDLRCIRVGVLGEVLLHLPLRPLGSEHLSNVSVKVLQLCEGAPASTVIVFEEHMRVAVEAGRATLRYGPLRRAGSFLLAVEIEDAPVTGSPFLLRCVAGPADGTMSFFEAPSASFLPGEVKVRLRARDAHGNPCDAPSSRVSVHARLVDEARDGGSTAADTLKNTTPVQCDVRWFEGAYVASARLTRAGRYRFFGEMVYDDRPVGGKPRLGLQPTALGPPSGRHVGPGGSLGPRAAELPACWLIAPSSAQGSGASSGGGGCEKHSRIRHEVEATVSPGAAHGPSCTLRARPQDSIALHCPH